MQVFACQELAKTLSKVHASNNHSNVSQNPERERERDSPWHPMVIFSGATRTNVHYLTMLWLSTLRTPNTPTHSTYHCFQYRSLVLLNEMVRKRSYGKIGNASRCLVASSTMYCDLLIVSAYLVHLQGAFHAYPHHIIFICIVSDIHA